MVDTPPRERPEFDPATPHHDTRADLRRRSLRIGAGEHSEQAESARPQRYRSPKLVVCSVVCRSVTCLCGVVVGDDGFSIAFSGGGIRAAAFDCGLLWRLAESGICKDIEYLSCVSGGSFTGTSFLSHLT